MSAYGQSRPLPSAVSEAGVGFQPGIWRVTPTFLYWYGRLRVWSTKNGFALGLGGIVLLGAGLRVYALDYQSFWTDEIFSLITTDPTLTFREFWDRVLADTHPPIYYLALRLSSIMLGQSEIAARAPSAFFGVLTLCAAAILPGSSLERSSRLAFLLFLAISPGAVWYAREARSYGLLLLLSTVITLACVGFVRCRPEENRKAQAALITLAAFSALASFTHYFGFLLAAAAFLTCCLLTHGPRKAIVILTGSGVITFFVPWVIYHSRIMDAERTTWIGKLSVAASSQLVRVLVIWRTSSPGATRRHGGGAAREGLAPRCSLGSDCLDLRSAVFRDAGRGGHDFTLHANLDEPQHDCRSSGSVLDSSRTSSMPGDALGQTRGHYLSGCASWSHDPDSSRVPHNPGQ